MNETLTAAQRVALARHPERPTAGEYIRAVAKAGLRPAHIRVRGGNVGKHFLTVKTLPTSFSAPVSVAFEPEDPFALYVAKKLMK